MRRFTLRNMKDRFKILFVCGRNQWRSPTAERLYRDNPRLFVKSAGVSTKSRHQITESDILWADLIVAVDTQYKTRLRNEYQHLNLTVIEDLQIPDDYAYMDAELVQLIQNNLDSLLEKYL